MVWYLGKIKGPIAPKSFAPNGKPALYLSPEVSPGLKSTDVHLLLDLALLTSTGHWALSHLRSAHPTFFLTTGLGWLGVSAKVEETTGVDLQAGHTVMVMHGAAPEHET